MRKFNREQLKGLLYDGSVNGLTLVEDRYIGKNRWHERRQLTFQYGDKHYSVAYEQGLTEYQETHPFDDFPNEVPCMEVHLVDRVVKVWEPVNV